MVSDDKKAWTLIQGPGLLTLCFLGHGNTAKRFPSAEAFRAGQARESATGDFHCISLGAELLSQYVPVLSLDFDDAVFHSAASAAFLFQGLGQLLEGFCFKGYPGDQCHPFALAALAFALEANNAVAFRGGSTTFLVFMTNAAGGRLTALRAEATIVRGVDGARIVWFFRCHNRSLLLLVDAWQ